MYYPPIRETTHQYSNWCWHDEHYSQRYEESDEHLHYISNFNCQKTDNQRQYDNYQSNNTFWVSQKSVEHDSCNDWHQGNLPPIPKLTIKTFPADEMTGFSRGFRGRTRGDRPGNGGHRLNSTPRRGTFQHMRGGICKELRGRGRPRGRPRLYRASPNPSPLQPITHKQINQEKQRLQSVRTAPTSNEDTLLTASFGTTKSLSDDNLKTENSENMYSASEKVPPEEVQYNVMPNDIQLDKHSCIPSINLKEYPIAEKDSDATLHKTFPTIFPKALKLVLKKLEHDKKDAFSPRLANQATCPLSVLNSSSLTLRNFAIEEPTIADPADSIAIPIATIIATAAQVSSSTKKDPLHKSNAQISSTDRKSEESDIQHKITALDISKLKSKLKNVKYPEQFSTETQTDTLITNNTLCDTDTPSRLEKVKSPSQLPILTIETDVQPDCNDKDSEILVPELNDIPKLQNQCEISPIIDEAVHREQSSCNINESKERLENSVDEKHEKKLAIVGPVCSAEKDSATFSAMCGTQNKSESALKFENTVTKETDSSPPNQNISSDNESHTTEYMESFENRTEVGPSSKKCDSENISDVSKTLTTNILQESDQKEKSDFSVVSSEDGTNWKLLEPNPGEILPQTTEDRKTSVKTKQKLAESNYDSDATVQYSDDEGNLEIDLMLEAVPTETSNATPEDKIKTVLTSDCTTVLTYKQDECDESCSKIEDKAPPQLPTKSLDSQNADNDIQMDVKEIPKTVNAQQEPKKGIRKKRQYKRRAVPKDESNVEELTLYISTLPKKDQKGPKSVPRKQNPSKDKDRKNQKAVPKRSQQIKQKKTNSRKSVVRKRKNTGDLHLADEYANLKEAITDHTAHQHQRDDDDDLPTILPPKRRRINSAIKKSKDSTEGGMERLYQEFPRHNWLENKYMKDETISTPTEAVHETEFVPTSNSKQGREDVKTDDLQLKSDSKQTDEMEIHTTMDTEVTTTTTDGNKKPEDNKAEVTSNIVCDAEKPLEEDSNVGIENDLTIDLREDATMVSEDIEQVLNLDNKTTRRTEHTPLDLCVNQGEEKTVIDNQSTEVTCVTSKTCNDHASLDSKEETNTSAEKSIDNVIVQENNVEQGSKSASTDNPQKNMCSEQENDQNVKSDTQEHRRDTKSAPLNTDNSKDVVSVRDSHSVPLSIDSSQVNKLSCQSQLSIKESTCDDNNIQISLNEIVSKETIFDKSANYSTEQGCLDLTIGDSEEGRSACPKYLNTASRPEKEGYHRSPEIEIEYLKHLKEFREMERAEYKMAKERQELRQLKHEKALLLRKLGSECYDMVSKTALQSPCDPESQKPSDTSLMSLCIEKEQQNRVNLAFNAKSKLPQTINKTPPPAHNNIKENFYQVLNRIETGALSMPRNDNELSQYRKRKQPVLDPPIEPSVTLTSKRKIPKAHSQAPFESAGNLIFPLPSFLEHKSKLPSLSNPNIRSGSPMNRSSSAPVMNTSARPHNSHQDHNRPADVKYLESVNQEASSNGHQKVLNHVQYPSTRDKMPEPSKNTIFSPKHSSDHEELIQNELNAAIARRQRSERSIGSSINGASTTVISNQQSRQPIDHRESVLSHVQCAAIVENKQRSESTSGQQCNSQHMHVAVQRTVPQTTHQGQTLLSQSNINPMMQTPMINRPKSHNERNENQIAEILSAQQQQHQQMKHHQDQPKHHQHQHNQQQHLQQQHLQHQQQQIIQHQFQQQNFRAQVPTGQEHVFRQQQHQGYLYPPTNAVRLSQTDVNSQRVLVGGKSVAQTVASNPAQYMQKQSNNVIFDPRNSINSNSNESRIEQQNPFASHQQIRLPPPTSIRGVPVRVTRPPTVMNQNQGIGLQRMNRHSIRYPRHQYQHQNLEQRMSHPQPNGQTPMNITVIPNTNVAVHHAQMNGVRRTEGSVTQFNQNPGISPQQYQVATNVHGNIYQKDAMNKQASGQTVAAPMQPNQKMHPEIAPNVQTMHKINANHSAATVMTTPGKSAITAVSSIHGTGHVAPATNVTPEQTNGQSTVTPPHLQHVNGNCVVCGKFAMFLCSNCQKLWYCSQTCQLNHWVSHSHECKNFTAGDPNR